MDTDPVKKILISYDASVSEQTIKQFQFLFSNLRINDYSVFDTCLEGAKFQLKEREGWINSKDTFELIKQYMNKTAGGNKSNKQIKITPDKTPQKTIPSKFADDFSARKNKVSKNRLFLRNRVPLMPQSATLPSFIPESK